jgi:hypothetical protein
MEGYARLGDRSGRRAELLIHRRFAAIQAQNILYLQAEIHELESDLREIEQENAKATPGNPRSQYARNWHRLSTARDADRAQWNTFCLLREKLKEYNKALIDQALLDRYYQPPKEHDLDILKHCLTHPSYPDYLLGKDSTIWEDKELRHDLITLGTNSTADGLTEWIAGNVVKPFHQLLGGRILKPSAEFEDMTDYSEQAITRLASLVATVISSVFPIVGVIILYFVKDLLARIGIIAGLTAA